LARFTLPDYLYEALKQHGRIVTDA
jgi:hypothetical protein